MHKNHEKRRIIVYALTERRGGIESFFINYLKHLNKFFCILNQFLI